ncbi:MAG TPA: Tex family protein, partial [Bacteroidales bacterium]|nr:Tex family protein [Bacteroidales bacterium]
MYQIISKISNELNIASDKVNKVIKLLEVGASIPFIARYRKEITGNLDEVAIKKIRDIHEKLLIIEVKRQNIINYLKNQNILTPVIENELNKAKTLSEIEDIYLPYKPKKKSKATIAKNKGLEPLAEQIFLQNQLNIYALAEKFISLEKEVFSIEEALQGARDIIAEWINENKLVRSSLRNLFFKEAIIHSEIIKDKEKEGDKYKDYFSYKEIIAKTPSYRLLAIYRGEKEGFLKVKIFSPEIKALTIIQDIIIKNHSQSSEQVKIAIKDAYKRLLLPSLETQTRNFYKEKADDEAIKVFSENLKQLLLAPPLGKKRVLAIDPGFKNGCKLVCLNENGVLLYNETIYPHPPQAERKIATAKLKNLVKTYKIDAIAIGNGTASRETENFIKKISFDRDVIAIIVNESGASVYSASAIAREEFPNYDVMVRGAVSIGRRLIDPLAELVKIEPKAIGVGQYQHDVDQNKLQKSLEETVMSCVNAVGVDVNTASKELLTYVSGIGPSIAANIIKYRDDNGPFKSREELKKVPRLGEKVFEQAAGFLKIPNALNPLDNSAVHPESYYIVEKIASDLNCEVKELINNYDMINKIKIEQYIDNQTGLLTLTDILEELKKPGRDPRQSFKVFEFDKNVHTINDIKIGMILPAIITNITAFGVFVDLGIHQDGLVHIS